MMATEASSARACTLSTTSPSVTICSPSSGSTASAPVHVVAGTTDNAHPVTAMKVYLDFVAVYSVSAKSLDTFISASNGSHNITINAWDSSGAVFKSAANFTVSTTTTGSVTIAPTSLTFASQTVGIVSNSQTVTLSNTTSSSVSVSSVTASGDFAQTNNCASTVAANSSCTISVTFTPTAIGTRTGTLSVTDSAGTQTASLTGTGASSSSGAVALAPTSLTFGSQIVGTVSNSQTITLSNTTSSSVSVSSITVSGDFAQTNNCPSSLAASSSCTISVTFSPTATGTRTGTLTVTDSAGTQTASLTGTGASSTPSACTLSTASPSVTICSPASGSTVPSPVHVLAGTTDNAHAVTAMKVYLDFVAVYSVSAKSVDTFINASNGNHNITVNAWDTSGAVFKSAVNFTVGATSSGSVALSPSSLTFASQTVGTTSNAQSVTLSNTTASSVSISSISASGDFAETNTCATSLAANSSCTVNVTFTPTVTGTRSGTLTVSDSAGTRTASLTGTGTNTAGLSNIRHIIFYVLENRSFDNYFGLLPEYRASKGFNDPVDGLNLNTTLLDSAGNSIQPYHYQTVCTDDISNSWNDQHLDYDNGSMDLFMKTVAKDMPSNIDPFGERAMGYYDSTDLPFYYALATEFATSDSFFSSMLGPTIPNRMYLFAGTSFGHIRPDSPPSGGWTQPTIFDHLDAAGVSWRYYYQDNSIFLAQWSTWSRDRSKVHSISGYAGDLQNESTLPSVIFIERPAVSNLDEHPGNNVQSGAANTAKLINELLSSPSWASSVFILTYDEEGGLYDHVLPQPITTPDSIAPMLQSGDQPGDFAHTGFRVPFVILSPWVKPHYVSHTVRDFTSILKLIETRFNVQPLTARDAAADDMTEFFDFSSPTLLNPPALPTQPTSGTCNKSLEKAPGQ